MSLILDALKKSESERRERPVSMPQARPVENDGEGGVPRRTIMLGLMVLVAFGFLSVIMFLQRDVTPDAVVAEEQSPEPTKTMVPGPADTSAPETKTKAEPIKPSVPSETVGGKFAQIAPKKNTTKPAPAEVTTPEPKMKAESLKPVVASESVEKKPPQITPEKNAAKPAPAEETAPEPKTKAEPVTPPAPPEIIAEKSPIPEPREHARTIKKHPRQLETPTLTEPAPPLKEQLLQADKTEPPARISAMAVAPQPPVLKEITPRFSPPIKPAAPVRPPVSINPELARQHLRQAEEYENNGQIDLAIDAYGRAIRQDGQNADAYFARGWLHEANHAYTLAIGDFSKAIRLNTGFADAYFARAWVYEQSGNTAAAITDYSNVVRLEPEHMNATLSRGILRFYDDQKSLATTDFRRVYERADAELSDYGLLWMYVTRILSSADPSSVTSELSSVKPRTEWPGILFRSFIGTASVAEVLASMHTVDPLVSRQRECVGYFFLGQHRLALGDKKGAREYFIKTLESGITSYRQYWAAKTELKQLTRSQ